jgi:putative phosphoesterase
VVSDTHLPRFGRALPAALVQGLSAPRVDLILHLGDLTDLLAIHLLEAIAPVRAVAGNNDGPDVHRRYPEHDVVEIDGFRLGITHGHAGSGRTTQERALRRFGADVDAVLFGHSHIPVCRRVPDGRLVLNPGSPTDRRRQPQFSFALLEISGGRIARVELRRYPDRTAAVIGSASSASA